MAEQNERGRTQAASFFYHNDFSPGDAGIRNDRFVLLISTPARNVSAIASCDYHFFFSK